MKPKTAIILFAHGSRDPDWSAPFERIRRQVEIARPEARVELAYLESTPPKLVQAAEKLIAQGVRSLIIAPLFMGQGAHAKRDLPELVESLRSNYPSVTVRVLPALSDAPEVLDFIAAWIGNEAAQG